jgi:hypothetical protein
VLILAVKNMPLTQVGGVEDGMIPTSSHPKSAAYVVAVSNLFLRTVASARNLVQTRFPVNLVL